MGWNGRNWHRSLIFALFCAFLLAAPAYPQEDAAKFPSRPINYIVPLPPGGGTDLGCRLIAKEAEKILGQPVVIVNKPGGALTIGVAALAATKPDGYTIGYVGGGPLVITPFLEKVPYNPMRDFTPIMQYGGYNAGVIVKADSPLKSFQDLIAFARQNPKKLTYGTSGTLGIHHITMEQIAKKENIQLTHIPFRGTPESQTALLGGHLMAAAGDFNASMVESGQVRVLMVLRDSPSPEYPGIPVLKDVGYLNPYPMAFNVYGPRGMNPGIVKKIEDAYTQAMKQPAFVNGMKELRLPIVHRNSKELAEYMSHTYQVFEKLIKEMSIPK